MTLSANQQTVQDAYQKIFGRDASFNTLGGANYWVDQIENNSLDAAGLEQYLKDSAEGQTATTDASGNISTWLGGVNPNLSIAENQAAGGTWADHFKTGGALTGDLTGTIWDGMAGAGTASNPNTTQNVAQLLNQTYNANNPNATLQSPYYNNAPLLQNDDGSTNLPVDTTTTTTGDGTTNNYLTADDLTAWWDALDKSSFSGSQTSTGGGMDDFMKFMMLMSVMKGGGGGGYGGSQYGYGGLNPGGVMQAYDPLAQLQGMGTWFKDNFGSGGATTSTVNTGTAGN